MRRIDYKNRKKSVREQALSQYRATRSKLEAEHPELLHDLRARLIGGVKAEKSAAPIPVDRHKNLETVMRFLELSDNPAVFKSRFADLLGK